jgi:hypothetical protein
LVALDEVAGDADVAQPLLMVGFAEPAAVVDIALWDDDPRQIRRDSLIAIHGPSIVTAHANRWDAHDADLGCPSMIECSSTTESASRSGRVASFNKSKLGANLIRSAKPTTNLKFLTAITETLGKIDSYFLDRT